MRLCNSRFTSRRRSRTPVPRLPPIAVRSFWAASSDALTRSSLRASSSAREHAAAVTCGRVAVFLVAGITSSFCYGLSQIHSDTLERTLASEVRRRYRRDSVRSSSSALRFGAEWSRSSVGGSPARLRLFRTPARCHNAAGSVFVNDAGSPTRNTMTHHDPHTLTSLQRRWNGPGRAQAMRPHAPRGHVSALPAGAACALARAADRRSFCRRSLTARPGPARNPISGCAWSPPPRRLALHR